MIERVTFYNIFFENRDIPTRLECVNKNINEEINKIFGAIEINQGKILINKKNLSKTLNKQISRAASEIDFLALFDDEALEIKIKLKVI